MNGVRYVEASTLLLKDADAETLLLLLLRVDDVLVPVTPRVGVQSVDPDGVGFTAARAKDGSLVTEDLGLTVAELDSLVGAAG